MEDPPADRDRDDHCDHCVCRERQPSTRQAIIDWAPVARIILEVLQQIPWH
ncbi:hypothetical protein AB0912_15610 [Streptomyces sp. NPDC007084]|uniref:hypothetical protein n=1 Tax=Streptomyces sp. NPDC007084 TaxID=3154313 RepID=UPI0034534BAE